MADYISNYSGVEIDQAIATVANHETRINTLTNRLNNWEASALSYQSVTGTAGIVLHCYRQGNIVSLVINSTTNAVINAWGTIATIPAYYRPRYQVFADNPLNSGQGFYVDSIETGIIKTNAQIPSGQGCWCTMTYIAKT